METRPTTCIHNQPSWRRAFLKIVKQRGRHYSDSQYAVMDDMSNTEYFHGTLEEALRIFRELIRDPNYCGIVPRETAQVIA